MEKQRQWLAGAAVLALVLALTACGQGEPATPTGPAMVEVACVPPAEVWVDGAAQGETPQTLTLEPGSYSVELKRDLFESQEAKIDVKPGETVRVTASLHGTDPGDPEVIRILAEAAEIETEPFEEGSRHRGSGSDEIAVLLWPKKDVRMEGLSVFGIEVSLDYMSDGKLQFKKGRKVLYSEPFEPEKVMTVAPIPAPVLEAVKAGDTVTWGLVFEKKRDNVTGKFKVVKGSSAAKALQKLERRKFYQRQPPLSQALMRAQVLENKRLYTESLLANLAAAQAFPTSTQPYQGIVTTLRRMDGKESELWTVASQYVGGSGSGRGRLRPGAGPGKTPAAINSPAPLRNWHPGEGPVRGEPRLLGSGGDAVTPGIRPVPEVTRAPGATKDPSAEPKPGTSEPGRDPGEVVALREQARVLERQLDRPRQQAEDARRHADDQAKAARQATASSQAATSAAEDARRAMEEAEQAYRDDDTNDDKKNAHARATEAFEEAAQREREAGEAAANANEAAQQADAEARKRENNLRQREQQLNDLYSEIARATGEPVEDAGRGSGPAVTDPRGSGRPGERPAVEDPRGQRGRHERREATASRERTTQARGRYQGVQGPLASARERVSALEARALEMLNDPGFDPNDRSDYDDLLTEVEQARGQLTEQENDARGGMDEYVEALRDQGRRSEEPTVRDLTNVADDQHRQVLHGREQVAQAEETARQNTGDAGAAEALAEARASLAEAEAALAETLGSLQDAIGD